MQKNLDREINVQIRPVDVVRSRELFMSYGEMLFPSAFKLIVT